MSRDKAVGYCEDLLDLDGEDASVWYQYAIDGYIKVPLWEPEIADTARERAA